MPVMLSCPECGKSLQAGDHLIGKTVGCPGCGKQFVAEPPVDETLAAEAATVTGLLVACPRCQNRLSVPESLRGKRVRCPSCQTLLLVPESGTAAAPAAVAPASPPPPTERPAVRARPGMFGKFFGGVKGLFSGGERDPEESAWLRNIALDPENLALRLDYANWLTRHGNPLGDYIHCDQEMQTLDPHSQRYADLQAHCAALLEEHAHEWFAPLEKLGLLPTVHGEFAPLQWLHGGILDEVTIDRPGILPERASVFFAAVPGVRRLVFEASREDAAGGLKTGSYRPKVPRIVALPQMEQIASLKLASLGLATADVLAIVTSPHLGRLAELDLSYNILKAKGAEFLAVTRTLPRLKALWLRGCELGPAGATALAGSPNLGQLTLLSIGANKIGPELAELVKALTSPALATLELDDNDAGPELAEALAAVPALANLDALDVRGNPIGPEGAWALCQSPYLGRLSRLTVHLADVGPEGALTLSQRFGSALVLD